MTDPHDGSPTSRTPPPATTPITTPITADLLRGALDLEHTDHGVLPCRGSPPGPAHSARTSTSP